MISQSRAQAVERLSRSQLGVGAAPRLLRPVGGASPSEELDAAVRAALEGQLVSAGALLFRGFGVTGAAEFQRFVQLGAPRLLNYDFASTPRSRVAGQIYTSTEYPAHQHIPLHNEQSYASEWPLQIWFCCAQAASQGGNTPIADSREVLRRVPADVRRRFSERGVMYVRNYGNGLDLPWQKVFDTGDRAVVERYCASAGIECQWKTDGELRTRQVCQALATHPVTGEQVWFNQAHLFHVSNLEPAVREALLAVVAEDELPRTARYGDGTAIPASDLEAVRAAYRAAQVEFEWHTGDVLVLDNMLFAHGRGPYQGPRKILVAMAHAYRAPAPGGLAR
jgi:alpha-ketoglutarate-dependent taurine dioxygenase